MTAMKTKILAACAAVTILAVTGCVDTVGGRKTVGVPFIKDQMAGKYDRPLEEVFQAAKDVIKFNGTLTSETIPYGESNVVKIVEGKVNQRSVWVRCEQESPRVTAVTVQTRTKGGGTDLDLAHDIEKQILIKLLR
jgi:hypothetical protein